MTAKHCCSEHQFKSFHTGLFILHRRNSCYAPRYPLGDSESWQPSTARSLFRCPTQTLHCVFQNKHVLRTGRHNLIPMGTRFSTPVQTGPEARTLPAFMAGCRVNFTCSLVGINLLYWRTFPCSGDPWARTIDHGTWDICSISAAMETRAFWDIRAVSFSKYEWLPTFRRVVMPVPSCSNSLNIHLDLLDPEDSNTTIRRKVGK